MHNLTGPHLELLALYEKEEDQSGLKIPQSKPFLYVKLPTEGKFYFCLHQNIALFTWVWFLKKDLLKPVVRPDSTRRWPISLAKGIRSYAGRVKSYVRLLMVFRGHKRQGGTSEGVIALPCYGQVCLSVHNGYKVFDWPRKTVTKVFDPDVESSRILEEIERLQHISKFDFSPSIRKWNMEERWYEEDLLNGSPDSSYTPMDSETVLTKFHDAVVHQLRSLILFQEPTTTNLVTYVADMIKKIRCSRMFRQESTDQACRRLGNFMDCIVGGLQKEGDHPIFLAFTHGDFVPANMLNTQQGIKIIDWEGAGYRSALFDFYSYFFYRSASRNIPVSTLLSEVQKALPLFIAKLAKDAQDVARSAGRVERVYRWTFYIEMLDRLVERETTDKNLPMLIVISRYLETFTRYEDLLAGKKE